MRVAIFPVQSRRSAFCSRLHAEFRLPTPAPSMINCRTFASLTCVLAVAPGLSAAEPATYPELTVHSAAKRSPPAAVVEDWPHFLGPHFNATTSESPLLKTWPERGPNLVWEMQTGEGYATPV